MPACVGENIDVVRGLSCSAFEAVKAGCVVCTLPWDAMAAWGPCSSSSFLHLSRGSESPFSSPEPRKSARTCFTGDGGTEARPCRRGDHGLWRLEKGGRCKVKARNQVHVNGTRVARATLVKLSSASQKCKNGLVDESNARSA